MSKEIRYRVNSGYAHRDFVTRMECIEDLKRVIKKVKRLPTRDDIVSHSTISYSILNRIVGGIKEIAKIKELLAAKHMYNEAQAA